MKLQKQNFCLVVLLFKLIVCRPGANYLIPNIDYPDRSNAAGSVNRRSELKPIRNDVGAINCMHCEDCEEWTGTGLDQDGNEIDDNSTLYLSPSSDVGGADINNVVDGSENAEINYGGSNRRMNTSIEDYPLTYKESQDQKKYPIPVNYYSDEFDEDDSDTEENYYDTEEEDSDEEYYDYDEFYDYDEEYYDYDEDIKNLTDSPRTTTNVPILK